MCVSTIEVKFLNGSRLRKDLLTPRHGDLGHKVQPPPWNYSIQQQIITETLQALFLAKSMYRLNPLSRCEKTGFAKGEHVFSFSLGATIVFWLTILVSPSLCQQRLTQQKQSRNDVSWMLSFPAYPKQGKAVQKEKENQGQTSTVIISCGHITGSVQSWALPSYAAWPKASDEFAILTRRI